MFSRDLISLLLALVVCCATGLGSGFYAEVERRARQGDSEAQDLLSYMYAYGKGVPKDLEKSREWAALSNRSVQPIRRFEPRRPNRSYSETKQQSLNSTYKLNTTNRPGIRMSPRRPGEIISRKRMHSMPRLPAKSLVRPGSYASLGNPEFKAVRQGVRSYRNGRKWQRRLTKGGRILTSPITFTIKQSKWAIRRMFQRTSHRDASAG